MKLVFFNLRTCMDNVEMSMALLTMVSGLKRFHCTG